MLQTLECFNNYQLMKYKRFFCPRYLIFPQYITTYLFFCAFEFFSWALDKLFYSKKACLFNKGLRSPLYRH